jgi:hypothetical protein
MRVRLLSLLLFGTVLSLTAAEPAVRLAADDDDQDAIMLEALTVKGDRVEEFGVRARTLWDRDRSAFFWPVGTPLIGAVLPNTAASKAGLRPGDRIVKSDGRSTASSIFSRRKWIRLQQRKWAEVAAGKKNVTWTLEVESPGTRQVRTVRLVVPSPAPHWGAPNWQPPEGRPPAVVRESGPLAERSRIVLENGVWEVMGGWVLREFGIEADWRRPFLVYGWDLLFGRERHRIYVSQQRGRTDIILLVTSPERGTRYYLTSPAGALEKALRSGHGKRGEMPLEEAREGFQQEMDFWLHKVDKVSARWPLEVLPGEMQAVAELAAATETEFKTVAMGQRADSFLKLPPANAAQRALFADAFGRIGADEDRFAFTETSRGLDDKRVAVMRVDPSRPEADRYTLLAINGKPPKEADVKRWREQGRDSSAALGELPPISTVVDLSDVRVLKEEPAAIVFELPIRGGNREFPAEKFQAVFRVNKTYRAFEDIAVKLREAFRVAGVVKVTEAGMEIRFQKLDPDLAPQPVSMKAGGAVRLLLVKFGRSFEATRTDFRRVEPYVEP